MTVKIVTDSTGDIPPRLAEDLGITVVPLFVHFGNEVFRDGVDISADEFYRRLTSGKVLPKTAAPSPGDMAGAYAQPCKDGQEIISIHISSKLSATYSSALLGKKQAGENCRIEVIDSGQAAMGLGLLAIGAARRAKKGAALYDVIDWVHHAIPKCHIVGVVDTLEYLQKGGRIGKAQAFVGSLLQVKPIIGVRDGEVHPLERVRTRGKALHRLAEMAAAFKSVHSLSVFCSTEDPALEELAQHLGKAFPNVEIYRSRFGPVIGAYMGPGAVGVALIEA
ncbi:MAG: DegV family protein [Chloroflexi bacterium]|nr:DegV family protein [Chloroflexota bacterium]